MKTLFAFTGIFAGASLLSGAVLVDNFDQSALITNGNAITATQGEWYVAAFGDATTSKTLNTGADTLSFSGFNNNVSVYGYFQQPGTTHDLSVGDNLTLEISLTANVSSAFSAGDIPFGQVRYGLFNANGNRQIGDLGGGAATANFNGWTGYSASWLLNGAVGSSNVAANYYRQGGIANGLWNYGTGSNAHDSNSPVGTLPTASGGPAINAADPSLPMNLQLSLTRTAGGMEVSSILTVDGLIYGTSTGLTTDTEFSFDSVGLLFSDGVINDFDIDSISVIPEPSHYAMMFGVASLLVLMIRRRVKR